MSSKEQKMSENQDIERVIAEQCDKKVEQKIIDPSSSDEEKDPRDEIISNLEAKIVEIQNRERDSVLRIKAEMENMRRRTEQDVERAHKFSLERFINELLPVIDSLDRALEVADRTPNLLAIIEGVKLTLKSILEVVRKFGVEVISDINVPLDPNIHQAIAVDESEDIVAGNVLKVMQKGYTLNGRTIRAAIVTVAKAKD